MTNADFAAAFRAGTFQLVDARKFDRRGKGGKRGRGVILTPDELRRMLARERVKSYQYRKRIERMKEEVKTARKALKVCKTLFGKLGHCATECKGLFEDLPIMNHTRKGARNG